MDIHPTAILAMVDRIVESSTEDDLRTSVEGMRISLRGILPSVILQKLVVAGVDVIETTPLHAHVEELARQVTELTAENAGLEAEVAALRKQLEQRTNSTLPVDGHYTMEQFLAALTAKLRRSYGWRTDYICASQMTEGCTPVENETVQRWQNTNKVPEWAVEQISRLRFRKRTGNSGSTWSDDNEDYLTVLYTTNPTLQNSVLAKLCEEKFGRTINENSIKGALDRLRKRGQVASKRPARR